MSQVRQNFNEEAEAGINKQINIELRASYIYQSMGFWFDRSDVALPGFSKYFSDNSKEEREHAEKLMGYLNQRGGRLVLHEIKKPQKDEWGSGLEALKDALDLEKEVNGSLLKLHQVATNKNDPHLCDFLENEFLNEQVKSIKELSDMITKLNRAGPGLGEFIFDRHLTE